MFRRVLAVAGVIALTLPATAAFAANPDNDPSSRFQKSGSHGPVGTTFTPRSISADGKVTVVVQLAGDPVAVVQAEKGAPLSSGEKSSIKSTLKKAQDAITGTIKSKGGKIEAQMQSAYNGIQASIPEGQVDAVAALPNVIAVHAVGSYTIDNAVSVPFLGVPQVWQNTGYTGTNVKVAIIDTGIDYTHANFNGPGTVAAYEAAHATETQPADPALFGPYAPRVKGGYDFVGDAYDGTNTPQPDSNPLDCEGHGSHVAGTAAGSGVNADGTTFTGPYDATTPSKEFTIGPGVAPQADLYALRVFGCKGSTNVVVPAIDWAVDHGMNVINMSLGSDYGRGDDPDAVAASNAVGAGVVVVVSAGNAGPSPYLVGSPSTGDGVISVAAMDSTASFPGATLSFDGKTVQAINANGADLSGLGALTIVPLKDNPATPGENEALGCSVAAYTFNGIVAGGKQMALPTRGVCARAGKAVFGQQAGAAVVTMINSTDDFPPYEGPITSNPDDGSPYVVTIPFLGVKSSDGVTLTAAAGKTVTVAPSTIANPGFRDYASFTSSGPRSGDSALGPDVAAPGVSIKSTAVGTGNQGEVLSGTSMAAPHVAGVAALAVEAHPKWSASQVSSVIVSTADPDGLVAEDLVRGGVGLVDTAQAVATKVTATGDAFRTDSGWLREAALSFGFQESPFGFFGIKTITLQNYGTTPVTYQVSSAPSAQSAKAKIVLSRSSVTVPAGGKAIVLVALAALAKDVGTSAAGVDQFSFYQFSGDVKFTATSGALRVPYLLVPRSTSRVSASNSALLGNGAVVDATKTVKLRNPLGALAASADFYTWGLSDPKDLPTTVKDTGIDLRAAGVQSFADGDDQLMVFAVNNYHRWSNAANNEYDVDIDTNGDGKPDYVVLAADSGSVTTGSANGITGVFYVDLANPTVIINTGFLASAPTDSSTLLMPVYASDLGLTATKGSFSYTVASFSNTQGGSDSFDGSALYNPWSPALGNGQFETVPRNGSVTVPVAVNAAAFAAQKPLGVMTVVIDNTSGAGEALLIKAR